MPPPTAPVTLKRRFKVQEGSKMSLLQQPRRDSNPQSSDPKSDALSIRPRGHTAEPLQNPLRVAKGLKAQRQQSGARAPDCCRFMEDPTSCWLRHTAPWDGCQALRWTQMSFRSFNSSCYSSTRSTDVCTERSTGGADLHPGAGAPPLSSHRVLPGVELFQTLTAC